MKWAYAGFDGSGAASRGVLEAATADEARDAARRKGLFVTEVRPAGAGDSAPSAGSQRADRLVTWGKTRRLKDLALFMRQLSVLISTGTPAVEAITVLERQLPDGAWRTVVSDVRRRVEEGSTLSAALEAHPGWFDPVCRSLIAAGESRGKLGDMLVRLSALTRQQLKIRGAVAGAMVYPAVLMCVAVSVMGLMIGFVMPRFEGLFEQLGAPLPPSTAILMDAGRELRQHWYFYGGALLAAVAGLVAFLRSDAGRLAFDRAAVRLPQLGKVTRAFATARIARVLGVLLEGKVALLDALALTRQASGNSLYAALIERAEQNVTRGETVTSALEGSSLISPSVVEALRSGERTGQVAPVLLSIADFLDEDNEVVVKTLTSIIEPLILMVLGVAVGLVAMCMFLPLFDLTSAGAGGG